MGDSRNGWKWLFSFVKFVSEQFQSFSSQNWKVFEVKTPFNYECDHAVHSYQSLSFFWKALVTYKWIIDVASHISVVINQPLVKLWGNVKKGNTLQLSFCEGQLVSEKIFEIRYKWIMLFMGRVELAQVTVKFIWNSTWGKRIRRKERQNLNLVAEKHKTKRNCPQGQLCSNLTHKSFIRPKYDHCLALSVPEFLTHSSCWIHATFPKATQPFLVLSPLVKSVSSKELIGFRKPMQCLFGRQSCRQLVKVVKWICYSCYMDLWKLLHVIVKTGICISRPIPTKPVWSLSKILTLVDWLRAVNRVDRLTALGPDVHCAFGNVYISDQFFWHGFPFLG